MTAPRIRLRRLAEPAWCAAAVGAVLLALVVHATAQQPRPEQQPVRAVGDRWIPIGGGARLAAFATHALDAPRPEIETAVIVIHGLLRDTAPFPEARCPGYDPNHRALDRSCAATAQGPHRLGRGEAYHRHVLGILGAEAARTHRKVLVEGVGHDHARMFQSPAGLGALFGAW